MPRMDLAVANTLSEKHLGLKRGICIRFLDQLQSTIPEDRKREVRSFLHILRDTCRHEGRMAEWETLISDLASRKRNLRSIITLSPEEEDGF